MFVYNCERDLGKKSTKVSAEGVGGGAIDIRDFKIYDATVTKTSLKIASSSLSIFSIVINLFNF